MKSASLLSLLVIILFSSCQKSIVWDDLVLTPPTIPVTPTSGGGSLLSKVVSLSATDTLTNSYTYDTTKKLIKVTQAGITTNVSQSGISSGDKVDQTEYFIRDAFGKLIQYTKIAYSKNSALPSKYDTLYSKIHYPAGSSNFDYAVEYANSAGGYITDSIVFTYTNNKISQYKYFSTTSGVIAPVYYISVQYDVSGNVIDEKYYFYNGSGVPTYTAENTYTYDAKQSPLQYGNESFIGREENFTGPNNALTLLSSDRTGNTNNTVNISYNINYNPNNYPAQAIGTYSTTGLPASTLRLTYFYQ